MRNCESVMQKSSKKVIKNFTSPFFEKIKLLIYRQKSLIDFFIYATLCVFSAILYSPRNISYFYIILNISFT